MTTSEILDCHHIGNDIYLHSPPASSSSPPPPDHPSLIILYLWLGGSTPRRINKYVSFYRKLYPCTTILVLRTTFLDILGRSSATQRRRLRPAQDVITSLLTTTNTASPFNGTLQHIFSSAGANTAIQLAHALREANVELPVRGVIFDCSPSMYGFWRTYRAAAHSIPEGLVAQVVGRAVLFPTWAGFTALHSVNVNVLISVRQLREELNKPALFGTEVRRLYLYSTADLAVGPDDVESHMEVARVKGYAVQSELFEGAGHCALISKHEARYTKAIADFWTSTSMSTSTSTNESNGDATEATGPISKHAQVDDNLPLRSKL